MSQELCYFDERIFKLECTVKELISNVCKLNNIINTINNLQKQLSMIEKTCVIDNFEPLSVVRGVLNTPLGSTIVVTLTPASTTANYPYSINLSYYVNGTLSPSGFTLSSYGSGFSSTNLTTMYTIDGSQSGVYPFAVTINSSSVDYDTFTFAFFTTINMNSQFASPPSISVNLGRNLRVVPSFVYSGNLSIIGGAYLTSLNIYTSGVSNNVFEIIIVASILVNGTNSTANISTISTNIQNILTNIINSGFNFIAVSN